MFLPGDPSSQHVSSSLVKEVVRYGGDVAGLVPDAVLEALVARPADCRSREPLDSGQPPRPRIWAMGAPPVISGVGPRPT